MMRGQQTTNSTKEDFVGDMDVTRKAKRRIWGVGE